MRINKSEEKTPSTSQSRSSTPSSVSRSSPSSLLASLSSLFRRGSASDSPVDASPRTVSASPAAPLRKVAFISSSRSATPSPAATPPPVRRPMPIKLLPSSATPVAPMEEFAGDELPELAKQNAAALAEELAQGTDPKRGYFIGEAIEVKLDTTHPVKAPELKRALEAAAEANEVVKEAAAKARREAPSIGIALPPLPRKGKN